MSTSASTTVSMSWLPTARSSASRVSGAELAPLDPTDDEATLCTSVIAHLQDQFAPHAALFEPFVRRRRALEHVCLANIRLQRAVLEHLRGKFQGVAVGLNQWFADHDTQARCLSLHRIVRAVRNRQQYAAGPNRGDEPQSGTP